MAGLDDWTDVVAACIAGNSHERGHLSTCL